ncbi:MAG: methyltransferase [Halobacteriovoraceae bacterium]|nr:methyltransferase [Halobacteriovoraceae bacterium]
MKSDEYQRLKDIEDFIEPFHDLWQYEILNEHPRLYNPHWEAWACELSRFDPSELSFYLQNYQSPKLSSEFNNYLKDIRELQDWNKFKISQDIFKNAELHHACRKTTPKKRHEINCIVNYFSNTKLDQIVDFAGGVGHLSQALSFYHAHSPILCLDCDENLLNLGKKRVENYCSDWKSPPQFENFSIKKDMELNKEYKTLLGLHCCGDLTQYILDYFKNSRAQNLLSVGCCYHKITDSIPQIPGFKNFQYSLYAKTLATRSHAPSTPKDLAIRFQVKKYRYSFELLLRSEFGITETSTLKSSLKNIYKNNFANYARHQLERLHLPSLSSTTLENFYQSPLIKKESNRLIYLGFLRQSLGRLIEMSIVLRRCVDLQNTNKEVSMLEIFDRDISQRNLAIVGAK